LTEAFNLAACRLELRESEAARDEFARSYRLMQELDNRR
jgi:hypothetical protein